MPEQTNIKFRPQVHVNGDKVRAASAGDVPYAELHVTTNFSFLRGASHPEELVAQAAEAGCAAVSITDLNSLAGVVRAHQAAEEAGIRLVIGCHVAMGEETERRKDAARRHRENKEEMDAETRASLFGQNPLHVLLYPTDRAAYGRLSRMLTRGKRRAEKGQCLLGLEDVLETRQGLLAVLLPPPPALMTAAFKNAARVLREAFDDDRLSVAASCLYDGEDAARLAGLAGFCREIDAPLVATNDVHYHVAERRPLQDVLTCIRLGCTLDEAGFALFANAERHIKGPGEMARLFRHYPAAIRRTIEIAERARFSLDELKYEYPAEVCPPGKTMMEHLVDRTWAGARERYGGNDGGNDEIRMTNDESNSKSKCPNDQNDAQPRRFEHSSLEHSDLTRHSSFVIRHSPLTNPAHPVNACIPPDVKQRLAHEFALIRELNYPAYFLTVDDIVSFARSKGILCQGRGAAANSAVCYCLGITAVDPARIDLLVERFISKERDEPPDIDIDFEHERREEVIQYLYRKYGRDRAALTAEVITYRRRSAVREVGKALGLSLDCVDRLAKSGDWWEHEVIADGRLRELGLDPHDRTLRQTITLAGELIGFPRHLSQHVGGFVISREPLCEIVPVENAAMEDRTVIEWDKDDIDAMGMLKVDVLGLGMLTCIRKGIEMVNGWRGSDGATKGWSDEGDFPSPLPSVASRSDKRERIGDDQGSDGATKRPRDDALSQESHDGEGANLSRSDCMAEGDDLGACYVHEPSTDARLRKVRFDQPDETCGCFDTIEYRGGTREADAARLSETPAHFARILGRVDDPVRTSDQPRDAFARSGDHQPSSGSRPDPARTHSKSGSQGTIHPEPPPAKIHHTLSDPSAPSLSTPSPLRRSVAPSLQFHTIPPEDPAVYDMLCKGDSVGVFQVESRAQMTMLPRLKPRRYYDLVIEVAIVRPGPIQGGMVHPYLRRRSGSEPVEYPSEAVKKVLERTLGVPIFQEQAMRLVMVAAGFTAGEADQLRRAMAAWKKKGHIMERFAKKIVAGMTANGYTPAYAQRVVEQIRGFSEYGFPESHAASFALLVYVSAWLKCHHPAAFAAALINSQPMGFYQPAQIVRDAREHGVKVLPIDVNFSGWDCRLEEGDGATERPSDEGKGGRDAEPFVAGPLRRSIAPALRLGMRLTSGLREADANKIAEAVRKHGRFKSIVALWRTSGVRVEALRQLAAADAFGSMGLDRQGALWATQQLRDDLLPMFEGMEVEERTASLPAVALQTRVVYDYAATGLSLKAHPIAFARAMLDRRGVTSCGWLADERRFPHGRRISVAGLVLVRQRPGTASGILFMTMEDESGVANLIVRPAVYDQYRAALRHSVGLIAHGTVERQGQVVHVMVHRAEKLSSTGEVAAVSRDFH